MIPPFIVQTALDAGIHLIAITDHNAIANIAAVQKAAKGTDLTVLAGMELQTREEVHVLCLFDRLEQAEAMYERVQPTFPPILNDIEHFGEQFIVDETGDFLGREDRLLLTSADLSIEDAWKIVRDLDGLFIPAHVNRKAFGLFANLGLVPADIPIEALEVSRHLRPQDAPLQFPQTRGYSLIQSGDVHRLDEFLGVNQFTVQSPCIHELKLAIHGKEGRSLQILSF